MPAYHEDPSIFPMEGGCSCGLLRYKITQAPITIHCCHCSSCQRETGTAFAINAVIESSSVEQLAPAPIDPHLEYTANPSASAQDINDALLSGYAHIPRPEDAPEPWRVTIPSDSGRGQWIVRCPACMTCVWTHYMVGLGGFLSFIKVGTLDEPWRLDPDVHIYTRSKRGFVTIEDGPKRYEAFYPDYREVYRTEGVERFDKLIVEIKAFHEAAAKKGAKED